MSGEVKPQEASQEPEAEVALLEKTQVLEVPRQKDVVLTLATGVKKRVRIRSLNVKEIAKIAMNAKDDQVEAAFMVVKGGLLEPKFTSEELDTQLKDMAFVTQVAAAISEFSGMMSPKAARELQDSLFRAGAQ